ncbi:MAG TPA: hypothetical protein VH120_08315 [Gemmataceae bacterium]|jgi:hypothetical protein|nr:hypothetical protein [Gemmataceae bacterium]
MRLFSWAGITALAAAAGGGFLAGEAVRQQDAVTVRMSDAGELSDALPIAAASAWSLTPPQPVEEIDPSCPSTVTTAFGSQSMEPPLADAAGAGVIRPAGFELPAGGAVAAEPLSIMPYLTDDPVPALLPALGEVSDLTPSAMPDPSNPIFQAVKRFVGIAGRLPERPGEVTDKVRLDQPPVSEHPSALAPVPPVPKPDTTEVGPSELPAKPRGDDF